MKKFLIILLSIGFLFGLLGTANAVVLFYDDFETSWSGDFADGWIISPYRHGASPPATMAQTTTAHNGSYGLELTSLVGTTDWWAGVQVESLPHSALATQYDPYVSTWYYDDMSTTHEGQVYAVPDWQVDEDWTDVQLGGRPWTSAEDVYYYIAQEKGGVAGGWGNSGVSRSLGWHNLMFQLSSADNYIHFYIDGNEVGTSTRYDYTNLGDAMGLFAMGYGTGSVIFDDFEVGSSVPEPATMLLLGSGLVGLAGLGRKKFFKKS